MKLAGPHAWEQPKDRAGALAVLREAVELGINHIDAADFYGSHDTNEFIAKHCIPTVKI